MQQFISKIRGDSAICKEDTPTASFQPCSGNLFPKWPDTLYDNNLELWNFDGIALDGSTAVVISFTRDSMDAPGGLRVLVLATWEDATWCNKLIFSESTVTVQGQDTSHGHTSGVWRSDNDGGEARFDIDADISLLRITLNVPGKVAGTLHLQRSPGYDCLPLKTADAEMAATLFNTRPVAHASATADLTFFMDNGKSERKLQLSTESQAIGGLERLWSPLSFNKIVSEYLYVRAQAGPYCILAMEMTDKPERNREISVSARLYYNGKLVCSPQNKCSSEKSGDVLLVERVGGQDSTLSNGTTSHAHGIRGVFRDATVAHRLKFRCAANDKTWCFELRHERPWWSIPTSRPGPEATGLSGFIDSVTGGELGSGEQYQGIGRCGQAQMH